LVTYSKFLDFGVISSFDFEIVLILSF